MQKTPSVESQVAWLRSDSWRSREVSAKPRPNLEPLSVFLWPPVSLADGQTTASLDFVFDLRLELLPSNLLLSHLVFGHLLLFWRSMSFL